MVYTYTMKLSDSSWVVIIYVLEIQLGLISSGLMSEPGRFEEIGGSRGTSQKFGRKTHLVENLNVTKENQISFNKTRWKLERNISSLLLKLNSTNNIFSSRVSNNSQVFNPNKSRNNHKLIKDGNISRTYSKILSTNNQNRTDLTLREAQEPRTFPGFILMSTVGIIEAVIVTATTLGLGGASSITSFFMLHYILKILILFFTGVYFL